MCRIDPRHENPEERRVPFEPVSFAQSMRPRLVAAALTLLRARAAAGRPDEGIEPFGSLEAWSNVVRGALGQAGPRSLGLVSLTPGIPWLGIVRQRREHFDVPGDLREIGHRPLAVDGVMADEQRHAEALQLGGVHRTHVAIGE